VVTSDDDESLNDNCLGSYNQYAPGADRYTISANLVKLPLDDVGSHPNFVELFRINLGILEYLVKNTDYSLLSDTLARRTYDQAGDYTVTPFKMQLKEHRNNDRGIRKNTTAYILEDIIEEIIGGVTYTYVCVSGGISASSPPTWITTFGTFTDGAVVWEYTTNPTYNRGIHRPEDTVSGDESKFVIALEAGKAYVGGYELEKIGTSYVDIDKPRSHIHVIDSPINVDCGNYVRVTNLYSIPPVFSTISLYDQYVTTPGTLAGTLVGTAIISGIEPDDTIVGTWKVFLLKVVLDKGKTFSEHVRSLYYNTGALNFTANLYAIRVILTGSISAPTSVAVTGVGTIFTSELNVGDYITVDGTSFHRVSNIATDLALTLDTTITATGSAFYAVSQTIYEPNNFPELIQVPQNFPRNIKSPDDSSNNTIYNITRNFGALAATAGSLVITLSVSGETFASALNATNFLVINTSTGAPIVPTYSVDITSKILTITGLSGSTVYNVTGTITKHAAQRTKTLSVSYVDVTTSAGVSNPIIKLGISDCYRIVAVQLAPAFGAITTGGIEYKFVTR